MWRRRAAARGLLSAREPADSARDRLLPALATGFRSAVQRYRVSLAVPMAGRRMATSKISFDNCSMNPSKMWHVVARGVRGSVLLMESFALLGRRTAQALCARWSERRRDAMCADLWSKSDDLFFVFCHAEALAQLDVFAQSSLFKCWMLLTFNFINMFLIKCEKFLTSQEQLDINYHISPDGILRSPTMHMQCV